VFDARLLQAKSPVQTGKNNTNARSLKVVDSMSKKTVVLLIGVIMTVSVLSAGCAFNAGNPKPLASPTNTYDSATGFTIKYPLDWAKSEPKSGAISVLFRIPTNNATENLNVQVWNRSANDTLSNLTAGILSAVQGLSEFTQIEAGNTTLAGNPAYKIVYTTTVEGYYQKVTEIWTVKGGKEYLITYKAAPSNYDTYTSTAQQMIDSFKIK
jgi:hypothetical protein